MAQSTGVNYNLGSDTLRAVREAGLGGEARERLQKSIAADAAGGIAQGVVDDIQKNRKDRAEGLEKWDSGFDRMEDESSWASSELKAHFHTSEKRYRDEYVKAVRMGDKVAQEKMLKEQANRASGLNSWKETMETAKEINDMPGGGWSNAFEKDPRAKAIINALTKLDGKSAVTRFGKNGEVVFDIKTEDGDYGTVTRREIDDMIAKATKPLKLKEDMGKRLIKLRKDAEEGKSEWDEDMSYQNVVDSIDEDNVSHYFNENILGKTTFREDFMNEKNPVWNKPIPIMSIDTDELSAKDTNKDGVIDKDEWELVVNDPETKKLIMDEMERQPDIAKHYIADWVVNTEKQNVTAGQTKAYNEALIRQYEALPNAKAKEEFYNERRDELNKAYMPPFVENK